MHLRILTYLQGLAFAAALAATPTLYASTIVAQSVEAMATEADAVVLAEVSAIDAQWHDGVIVTEVQLRVLEVWAGDVNTSTLTLRHLGGTLDGVRTHVAGVDNYRLGEQVVVFMERSGDNSWHSLALSWAVFHREGAMVQRRTEGLTRIAPPGAREQAATVVDEPNSFPLTELRARVRQAQESAQ